MRFLKALALICGLVAPAAANQYFNSPVTSTTTGTAWQSLSGQFYFAASSANVSTTTALIPTKSTWTITLDGPKGTITAQTFSGTQFTGIAQSTTAVALATTTLFTQLNSTASALTIEQNAVAAATTTIESQLNSTAAYATSQFNAVALATTTTAGASGVVATATTTWSGINTFAGGVVVSSGIYGVGVRDQFRNLTSSPTAAFPLTSINISADEALLENAASYLLYAQGVNVTITTGTAGLNGLDTGSPGASTWYYSWVISNGSTIGGLISLSTSAPTMPSGYMYKSLIGAVFLDGSKQVSKFRQYGKLVSVPEQVVLSAQTGSASWVQVSATNFIPQTAVSISGIMGNVIAGQRAVAIASDTNPTGPQECVVASNTAFDTFVGQCPFASVPIINPQTFAWMTQDATASDYRYVITSYTLR